MKKITAILFLFIYLFYTTGIHELFKFNALIDHYHETLNQEGSISFSQFLFMHYVTDDLNDRDNEQDKQLPFKSSETCVSNSMAFCIPVQLSQPSALRSFIITCPAKIFARDVCIHTDFNSSIWHPPQLV